MRAQEIRTFVEQNFDVIRERSSQDEIVFLCGTCNDSSGNRSVNVKTGLTSCWKCNIGGTIKSYAKRVGIEFNIDDRQGTTDSQEIEQSLNELRTGRAKGQVEIVTEVELPHGFTPLTLEGNDTPHRLARAMARRKNLDMQALVEAGAGVAPDNPLWSPYVIFPVIEWGRVVYYQGRTMLDPPGGSTKKFPSRKLLPRGSRYWIYNIDELRERGGKAIAVESILNVLSLKIELQYRGITEFVPIGVFKHKLSPEQCSKLRRVKKVEELVFLYDADATASADAEAVRLVNSFELTSVAPMPVDDANDNAQLAVDQILARRKPEVLLL
jgi:hypothetical protein